jgi:hypothetical protein
VDTQTWICDSTDPFACSYDANYLARADGFSSDIITYLFVAPGTYYVGVRGYQGEVGDYNLSVGEANEPNNTPEEATALSTTATGRLPAGDADWYSIEVADDEVGNGLRFTTSFPAAPAFANLAAADTQLFLCAEADVANCTFESGNLIAADVVGDYESLEFVTDAAGIYYLGVIAPNGSGFYALNFSSFNPGDVGEPGNDTADGALPLAVPGSAQGIIGASGDLDRFLVSITAPGSVTFTTSAGADPEVGDTQLALCDLLTPNCIYGSGAGVLVQNDDRDAGNDDYYSEVSYDFTEVGDYIVVVRGYFSATGGYTLTTSTP